MPPFSHTSSWRNAELINTGTTLLRYELDKCRFDLYIITWFIVINSWHSPIDTPCIISRILQAKHRMWIKSVHLFRC
jgi:hypothetical protein